MQRVRPVFNLGAHLRHVFADFLCHASSVFHRLDYAAALPWCGPAIATCAAVDLRLPAAQDAFLIISQFSSAIKLKTADDKTSPSQPFGRSSESSRRISYSAHVRWREHGAPVQGTAGRLSRDFDPHGACRALDALYRGFDGDGVQVGHLLLGNLQHLLLAHRSYFVLVRSA